MSELIAYNQVRELEEAQNIETMFK